MRRLLPLLTVVASLVAVAPAAAAVMAGNPWPGKVIRYHVSGGSASAVDAAAKAWNRSGLKIRFERSSKGRAGVVVKTAPKMGCAGFAQVGHLYPGPAGMRMGDCQGHEWPLRQIAVHEFGHILGLEHETRRCAVMNPVLFNGAPNRCKPPGAARYRCRPYERDDLRALQRAYGGRLKPLDRENCPLYEPPGALTELTATEQYGRVEVAFRAPAAPRPVVDTFSGRAVMDVEVAAAPGACPADPAAVLTATGRTRSTVFEWGTRQDAFLQIGGVGPHCVAARLTDPLGRSGPVATTTVAIAPAPVEASILADGYGVAGSPVAFIAYAYSEDPVSAYAWDFGDPASGAANRATGEYAEHTFSGPGTYTVTLAVQTARGATAVAKHTVTIDHAAVPRG